MRQVSALLVSWRAVFYSPALNGFYAKDGGQCCKGSSRVQAKEARCLAQGHMAA